MFTAGGCLLRRVKASAGQESPQAVLLPESASSKDTGHSHLAHVANTVCLRKGRFKRHEAPVKLIGSTASISGRRSSCTYAAGFAGIWERFSQPLPGITPVPSRTVTS